MADIDLAAIADQMKETIARAEETDPKALRARIRGLEAEIAEQKRRREHIEMLLAKAEAKAETPDPSAVERAFSEGITTERARIQDNLKMIAPQYRKVMDMADQIVTVASGLSVRILATVVGDEPASSASGPWVGDPTHFAQHTTAAKAGLDAFPKEPAGKVVQGFAGKITPAPPSGKTVTIDLKTRPMGALTRPRPQQAILDALAWLEAIGLDRGKRTIVAFLAGASPSSSAFMNNLGGLRSAGLIDYPESGAVALTASGRDQAAPIDAPRTPDALHQMIYSRLPGPQTRILQALIRVYPKSLKREALADLAGASSTSSAYMNNLGALRSLGLIDYPRQGWVRALPILFLEKA